MRKTYDKDFKLKVAKDIKNGTKTVIQNLQTDRLKVAR